MPGLVAHKQPDGVPAAPSVIGVVEEGEGAGRSGRYARRGVHHDALDRPADDPGDARELQLREPGARPLMAAPQNAMSGSDETRRPVTRSSLWS